MAGTMASTTGALEVGHTYDIVAREGSRAVLLGDVTLFEGGTACVWNDWEGLMRWFDDPGTGHAEALSYVRLRVCASPLFVW